MEGKRGTVGCPLTVYLNKGGKIKHMEEITKDFCKASTTKFNLEKTEALPIGSKEHQKKVIEVRRMNEYRIPNHITLIKDKEPMRTLGAWVENEVTIEEKWNKILEYIMEFWAQSKPTY